LVLFPWANPLDGRAPASTAVQTVQVAEAAASCGARRVLYWGSSAVYAAGGAAADKPRTESDPLATSGVAGRLASIDSALRSWAGDRPEVAVFLFRACSVVGRSATWPLDTLGTLRILPRLPQRPPLQVIAAVDAAGLLAHALRCDHRGAYNVAADGLIAASELARELRRPALPMPEPAWAAWFGLRRLFGLRAPRPGTASLLARQRVIDNGRMKTHLGYLPTLSGRQALAEWLRVEVNSPS